MQPSEIRLGILSQQQNLDLRPYPSLNHHEPQQHQHLFIQKPRCTHHIIQTRQIGTQTTKDRLFRRLFVILDQHDCKQEQQWYCLLR